MSFLAIVRPHPDLIQARGASILKNFRAAAGRSGIWESSSSAATCSSKVREPVAVARQGSILGGGGLGQAMVGDAAGGGLVQGANGISAAGRTHGPPFKIRQEVGLDGHGGAEFVVLESPFVFGGVQLAQVIDAALPCAVARALTKLGTATAAINPEKATAGTKAMVAPFWVPLATIKQPFSVCVPTE